MSFNDLSVNKAATAQDKPDEKTKVATPVVAPADQPVAAPVADPIRQVAVASAWT